MTYYELLEVKQDASLEEIKMSRKKLLKKYHPDQNPGKEEWANKKSAEINAAFDVLKDDKKRREYDDTLKSKNNPEKTPQSGKTSTSKKNKQSPSVDDIFSTMEGLFGKGHHSGDTQKTSSGDIGDLYDMCFRK